MLAGLYPLHDAGTIFTFLLLFFFDNAVAVVVSLLFLGRQAART
jgi:hypothetical protein